jgi:hypothetical protein
MFVSLESSVKKLVLMDSAASIVVVRHPISAVVVVWTNNQTATIVELAITFVREAQAVTKGHVSVQQARVSVTESVSIGRLTAETAAHVAKHVAQPNFVRMEYVGQSVSHPQHCAAVFVSIRETINSIVVGVATSAPKATSVKTAIVSSPVIASRLAVEISAVNLAKFVVLETNALTLLPTISCAAAVLAQVERIATRKDNVV